MAQIETSPVQKPTDKQVLMNGGNDPTGMERKTQYWRKKGESSTETGRPSRGELIRLKVEELQKSSSSSSLFQMHCEKGHKANQCRNATICFVCNRFGHRSNQCRSVTEIPVTNTRSQPTHSQSTERFNQCLENSLRCMTSSYSKKWLSWWTRSGGTTRITTQR